LFNKFVKNIPNILTTSRIISSIGGAISFVYGNFPLAFGLYTYGAVSDFFDGLTARKLNAFSELGRKLDAISDKLYAGSLLIPSILAGNFLMVLPLLFEIEISRVNLKAQKLGFNPKTQMIGKYKTAALFPTMILGLLSTIYSPVYLIFIVTLIVTTILQERTLAEYEDILEYNIKINKFNKNEKNTINNDNMIDISKVKKNKLEKKKNKYYFKYDKNTYLDDYVINRNLGNNSSYTKIKKKKVK